MKPFCEIIVSEVLPAMRAVITNELSNEYGLSQTQISKKLGLTQPAISQYSRHLRGKKAKAITSNEKIMDMIKKLSHDIALSDMDYKDLHERFCKICKTVRGEGIVCEMHEEYWSSIDSCSICLK